MSTKGRVCIHACLLHRAGPRKHVQAMANIVEVRGATVTVRDGDRGLRKILNSVNFSLRAGELHMLVGPNGCGKVPSAPELAASTEYIIQDTFPP
jgi:ABC-type glutathione transport system ATPase component